MIITHKSFIATHDKEHFSTCRAGATRAVRNLITNAQHVGGAGCTRPTFYWIVWHQKNSDEDAAMSACFIIKNTL
jgi:hypothetical protein